MLTEQQNKILEAVVKTMIPPDESPDGWEAGVGAYLFRQFAGDLKDRLSVYQYGLTAIDAEAQAVSGKPFADLMPDVREALLSQIERGQLHTTWPTDAALTPAAFIAMLAAHCAEGFYSDPGNGGNLNSVSWKMIGFEVTA